MTALAVNRDTVQIDTTVIPESAGLPVAANTIIYAGSIVCTDSAGRAVPASATATLVIAGVAQAASLNRTTDPSGGAAGATTVTVKRGAFSFGMGSGVNAITIANRGQACYASDDQTLNLTDGGGLWPFAGTIIDVVGSACHAVIGLSLTGASAGGSGSVQAGMAPTHLVRGATTANVAALATFTVANDGITLVAGDRVLLAFQTTASQNGVYVVGTVGGGTAPLTRALDFNAATTAEIEDGVLVAVAQGTLKANTQWLLTTNAPITVGTTDLAFQQVGGVLPAAVGQVQRVTVLQTATVPGEVAYGALDVSNSSAVTGVLRANNDTPQTVRGVCVTNVANLAAFVIAGFDGVTYAEGDTVLLANQTTGAESGIYVVGAVAGTAPLTRVPWLPAAAIVRSGYTVHASEGTLFANTSWFISTTGAITIGTTAHLWFPESVRTSIAFPVNTGTITVTTIPVLSATKTMFNFTNVSEVTADLTVRYGLNGAATAGVVGTASFSMIAEVAAGTVNVDDDSTMLIQVVNR